MAVRIPVGRDEELEIYVTRHHRKAWVHLKLLSFNSTRGQLQGWKSFRLDGDSVPMVFEQISKLLEKHK